MIRAVSAGASVAVLAVALAVASCGLSLLASAITPASEPGLSYGLLWAYVLLLAGELWVSG